MIELSILPKDLCNKNKTQSTLPKGMTNKTGPQSLLTIPKLYPLYFKMKHGHMGQ